MDTDLALALQMTLRPSPRCPRSGASSPRFEAFASSPASGRTSASWISRGEGRGRSPPGDARGEGARGPRRGVAPRPRAPRLESRGRRPRTYLAGSTKVRDSWPRTRSVVAGRSLQPGDGGGRRRVPTRDGVLNLVALSRPDDRAPSVRDLLQRGLTSCHGHRSRRGAANPTKSSTPRYSTLPGSAAKAHRPTDGFLHGDAFRHEPWLESSCSASDGRRTMATGEWRQRDTKSGLNVRTSPPAQPRPVGVGLGHDAAAVLDQYTKPARSVAVGSQPRTPGASFDSQVIEQVAAPHRDRVAAYRRERPAQPLETAVLPRPDQALEPAGIVVVVIAVDQEREPRGGTDLDQGQRPRETAQQRQEGRPRNGPARWSGFAGSPSPRPGGRAVRSQGDAGPRNRAHHRARSGGGEQQVRLALLRRQADQEAEDGFVIGDRHRERLVPDRTTRRRAVRGARCRTGGSKRTPDRGARGRCRRGDLNPHALAGTSPSSWRVCLFRHSDGSARSGP